MFNIQQSQLNKEAIPMQQMNFDNIKNEKIGRPLGFSGTQGFPQPSNIKKQEDHKQSSRQGSAKQRQKILMGSQEHGYIRRQQKQSLDQKQEQQVQFRISNSLTNKSAYLNSSSLVGQTNQITLSSRQNTSSYNQTNQYKPSFSYFNQGLEQKQFFGNNKQPNGGATFSKPPLFNLKAAQKNKAIAQPQSFQGFLENQKKQISQQTNRSNSKNGRQSNQKGESKILDNIRNNILAPLNKLDNQQEQQNNIFKNDNLKDMKQGLKSTFQNANNQQSINHLGFKQNLINFDGAWKREDMVIQKNKKVQKLQSSNDLKRVLDSLGTQKTSSKEQSEDLPIINSFSSKNNEIKKDQILDLHVIQEYQKKTQKQNLKFQQNQATYSQKNIETFSGQILDNKPESKKQNRVKFEQEFRYEGPIKQIEKNKRENIPLFCGIYTGSNVKENPHMKEGAKKFRNDIFQKLQSLSQQI